MAAGLSTEGEVEGQRADQWSWFPSQHITITIGPVSGLCPSAVVGPGSVLSSVYLPGASGPTGGLSVLGCPGR